MTEPQAIGEILTQLGNGDIADTRNVVDRLFGRPVPEYDYDAHVRLVAAIRGNLDALLASDDLHPMWRRVALDVVISYAEQAKALLPVESSTQAA